MTQGEGRDKRGVHTPKEPASRLAPICALTPRHFKNCLPEMVATYLNEHRVNDVFNAALLVDEYKFNPKLIFLDCPENKSFGSMSHGGMEDGRASVVVKTVMKPVMDGFVSLPGDRHEVLVKLLHDTAASHAFILETVFLVIPESAVG